MFDVAPSELLVLGAVALLVIPPKDLPKAMRVAGYWVGRARGVARQFRAGFDDMLRDAEFKEMEARWAAENERIMREHPPTQMLPLTGPDDHLVADPVPADHLIVDAAPALADKPHIHDEVPAATPAPPVAEVAAPAVPKASDTARP
jgi:sec-independent protein translocase protein TatB